MLRICTPLANDPIFELQQFAEHLVREIWCRPDNGDGVNRINEKYNAIVNYDWLREEIISIHALCSKLKTFSLRRIEYAFITNNKIEDLCNGKRPVHFSQLPEIVEGRMKPLFIKFYDELLEREKVGGDKLDYYRSLYIKNRFKFCMCCGYMPFDTGLLKRREAYDHYLPKSMYPFASVNFENLIPLCYKCNSDRKKDQDPIKNGRKAFYPFRKPPVDNIINTNLGSGFLRSLYESVVNNKVEEEFDIPKIEDVKIDIQSMESDQVETWNSLFLIRDRYSERTGQFSFSHLAKLKRRYSDKKVENINWTFLDTLNYHIKDYENDLYYDEKFLKIPFMIAIKNCNSLLQIYS